MVIQRVAVKWSALFAMLTRNPRRHWNLPFRAPIQCSDHTQRHDTTRSNSALLGSKEAGSLWTGMVRELTV